MIADNILNDFQKKYSGYWGYRSNWSRQVVDILYNAGANIRIVSLDDFKNKR